MNSLFLLTGTSVAINATYAVQHKGNAVVTVVAGGALLIALVLIAGITGRSDISKALAIVFLLSSALLHGVPVVEGVTTLATSAHKAQSK